LADTALPNRQGNYEREQEGLAAMYRKSLIRLLVVGSLSAAPLIGCATSDIDQLRSDLNDARAVADEAKASADEAKQDAQAARDAANDAKVAAEAAQASADDAKAASEANGDKLDRMFKKAMSK
jgi:hypothetical protein